MTRVTNGFDSMQDGTYVGKISGIIFGKKFMSKIYGEQIKDGFVIEAEDDGQKATYWVNQWLTPKSKKGILMSKLLQRELEVGEDINEKSLIGKHVFFTVKNSWVTDIEPAPESSNDEVVEEIPEIVEEELVEELVESDLDIPEDEPTKVEPTKVEPTKTEPTKVKKEEKKPESDQSSEYDFKF